MTSLTKHSGTPFARVNFASPFMFDKNFMPRPLTLISSASLAYKQ